MAQTTTLYRFRIDLSDVDRGVYDLLDFRVAMHPSESMQYLLTRVIAFALNSQQDLEFSPAGLGDPEVPAMRVEVLGSGRISLWIEIGNPSPKKLHKAAKAAQTVKVYTYKDANLILRECAGENIHQAEKIAIHALDYKFLDKIAEGIQRDNKWSLLHHDNSITISWGEQSETSNIKTLSLSPN
ncbi:YaeQ family protein [Bdellovibrio svalbardensis]|uniref:YaeQ family protein n=1 Tax=Bdellovibrio svalbardensis TaxID=2972972 RepID=A0ABT6DIB4_9BACT|nr:YaeQ family protein [Bdellovibrio svalbardensis]MDG0816592.1 YaeQ family protein [Bdellovibrio svalbardensis]